MLKRRILSMIAPRLASGIRRELVAMLYTTMGPLVMVGAIATAVAILVAIRLGSPAIFAVAAVIAVWTAARTGLLLAYRRRVSRHSIDGVEVQRWEWAYAVGSVVTGLLLGTMNYVALLGEDSAVHMLTSVLIFGYGAGLVVRVSVRPVIYCTSLAAAILPSIAGLLAHVGERASHGLPYGTMAFLYASFALGSADSARFLYRSTIDQLLTGRALAGLARKDVLTGLANRLLLRERFDESVASIARSDDVIALHLLDLDRFKPVNDRYGHPTGDALLKAVAERLSGLIRPDDTAARIGGDEFAIIQTGVRDVSQARALGDRIAAALAEPFQIGPATITIGTSIGIAFAPRDGLDLDRLSACADAALYEVKHRRRGMVAIWQEQRPSLMEADRETDATVGFEHPPRLTLVRS
jgi:diguanylate cyclase (GGDEF)-like protein